MFNYINQSSKNLTASQICELTKKAHSCAHERIEPILTYKEYRAMKSIYKSLYEIVEFFTHSIEAATSDYITSVIKGSPNDILIFKLRAAAKVVAFYKQEIINLKLELENYEEYLRSGNRIAAIFGKSRQIDDSEN